MEVLIKTNKGLQRLGEGKIFSKKQLKLREGIAAAIGSANGLQQAQQKAEKILDQNSNADSANADLGKLDGQNDTSTGEGIKIQVPVKKKDGTQLSNIQRMAQNQQNDNVEIEFTRDDSNNSSSSTNESRKNSKLVEMRYNSVPFTKKELSSFLKSI